MEDVGKSCRMSPKTAQVGPIRAKAVQNRLRVRIFTVDIRRRERKIPAVRFPDSAAISCFPPAGWESKETYEERL